LRFSDVSHKIIFGWIQGSTICTIGGHNFKRSLKLRRHIYTLSVMVISVQERTQPLSHSLIIIIRRISILYLGIYIINTITVINVSKSWCIHDEEDLSDHTVLRYLLDTVTITFIIMLLVVF